MANFVQISKIITHFFSNISREKVRKTKREIFTFSKMNKMVDISRTGQNSCNEGVFFVIVENDLINHFRSFICAVQAHPVYTYLYSR